MMITSYLKHISYIIMFVLLTAYKTSYSNELQLHLTSYKSEYKLKEPVKFDLRIINNTDQNLRIVSRERIQNMECSYFIITRPDGIEEYRNFQFIFVNRVINPDYLGELMTPGKIIKISFYPNVSRIIKENTINNNSEIGQTFPFIGDYQVRMVYNSFPIYKNITTKEGGFISNPVNIKITDPSAEEAEILEAYWKEGGVDISCGDDDSGLNSFNIDELEKVINKYPNSAMIEYALFGLGVAERNRRQLEISNEIFYSIRRMNPDFRSPEIQNWIINNHLQLNEYDIAQKMILKAVNNDPELLDYTSFVNKVIWANKRNCQVGEELTNWQNSATLSGNEKEYIYNFIKD